jgi:non-heme chloroperoxidase
MRRCPRGPRNNLRRPERRRKPIDHQAQRKTFTTSDGAEISYLEAGTGQPFIMIPGWSQTAEQWGAQIKLEDAPRPCAWRGHGDSNGVTHGFRITRLSKDVRDLIMALDLHDTVLMGHSMGCSVIWGYFDLWGSDRVAKLVLCDQSPFLSDNPLLSDQEKADSGVLFRTPRRGRPVPASRARTGRP